MNQADFKLRTKRYAVCIVQLVESLPRTRTCDVLGKQLLRCATSVGANYRAACRARSTADFIAKMGIVEEEADESLYWIEMLIECGVLDESTVAPITSEGRELLAMTVSSIRTARNRARNPQPAVQSTRVNPQSAI